ncbi:MAG: aromatic-ring-hydroxylating dioxygenase subunit beta [Alphaproteobacteria bacterium]|nr:aromatic-ring-hydroxylating dioxygenase subunit beta [Alphaproteobacteria bacterium]
MNDLRALEAFLHREAALLDDQRFEDWRDLLTGDATYWVPAAPDQPDPLDHVSLFYEDRTLLAMRIARLRHPQAHALAVPIRTSRIVGNVMAGAPLDGDVVVRSRFQIVERQGDRQRLFAGAYTHRLVPAPGGFAIRQKRVDLIDCDGLHEAIQIIL